MPLSLTLKQKLSNIAQSQASTTPSSTFSTSVRRNILNFARRGDKANDEFDQDSSNSAIGEEVFDELMQKVIRQSGLDYEYVPYTVRPSQGLTVFVSRVGRDLCSFSSPQRSNYASLITNLDLSVVVTAAEFPDPRVLSYDLLFQRVLRHLDLYGGQRWFLSFYPPLTSGTVESDYAVVFFVAGGRYAPGWSWVWKSYRSLHRKCVHRSYQCRPKPPEFIYVSRYRKNLKKLVRHFEFLTSAWV